MTSPVSDRPAEFCEPIYLALNPDLRDALEAGVIQSAFAHWRDYGRDEQRRRQRPTIIQDLYYQAPPEHLHRPPPAGDLARFSPSEYLDFNPDVAAGLGGNLDAALDHWTRYGRFEGRTATMSGMSVPRRADPGRLMDRPFGVNLYAPLSAQSGLGNAARGYARALLAAGIAVHLVNVDFSRGHALVAAECFLSRPPYRINLLQINADTIERFVRMFPEGWFDDAYNIGSWAWELNVLRPDWFSGFSVLDEVWAPSVHNRAAVQAIAPVPVVTINYAVAAADTAEFSRGSFNLPAGFLFLVAFDVGSHLARKNPAAVVSAFLSAFAGRTDVFLVLKFHSARHHPREVEQLLGLVRRAANILVRSETLSDDAMRGLQSCCDCLVSAHRAEGYGLNIAEFMLTDRPVIVTGYSGNMDFTDAGNSYLIPYTLQPLATGHGPYLPGYLWAEPDTAALAELMLEVVDDPVRAAEIGRRGGDTVRAGLSTNEIGAQMARRLSALGLNDPLPPFLRTLGRSCGQAAPPGLVSALSDPKLVAARPTLSVIVPVYNVAPDYLRACIESVRRQSYPHWELCLCDDASTAAATVAVLDAVRGTDPRIRVMRLPENQGISAASNAAVTMATGGWLVMLDNDDELAANALHEIAAAVVRDPAIDALYGDEDKLETDGTRCDTYFKPDWSPEHLESVMYTLHPLTVRTSLFLGIGGFRTAFSGAQDWDLMLRLSRHTAAISHIPKILYHWRKIPGSASAELLAKPDAIDLGLGVLADHVTQKYGAGNAWAERAPLPGHYRVRHRIVGDPLVTLCITTDNAMLVPQAREPFVMVQNLVRSILEVTRGVRYQILVVDNGNTPAPLTAWLLAHGVVMRSYPGPVAPFNFASKANFAISCIETEQLVLMNDDIEVINAEWLSALLEFSQQPDIGAVCGKLLHEDGTIQHVGTVLGVNGGSAHVYHGSPGDTVGYNGFTHVVRNYSALTAACLATRRSVLDAVGPWDTDLAIDYNDTDLCLRMRQQGYRLVYTPYSQAYHFESKTALRTAADPAEAALFMRRWGHVVANDPFYNPNLSRTRHDFAER
jgi:GT2 family glycosyltransferase